MYDWILYNVLHVSFVFVLCVTIQCRFVIWHFNNFITLIISLQTFVSFCTYLILIYTTLSSFRYGYLDRNEFHYTFAFCCPCLYDINRLSQKSLTSSFLYTF